MQLKNRVFIIILFLILVCFGLNANKTVLIGNYIKLIVFNDDASFMLYGKNNVNEKWVPLLFEGQRSTSYLRFYQNHDRIPFGEGGVDRYSEITIVNNSIHYFWQNTNIKVELVFTLVSSLETRSADTLIIDMKILNLSINKYNIEYYYCFDTYLGEAENQHFIAPGNLVINSETEYSKLAIPEKIQSISKEKHIGVSFFFRKEKQLLPDRIFFANWKKVDSNLGLYKIFENSSFSLPPYSMNDSAIFVEYVNQEIIPYQDHINRFIISMNNNVEIIEKSPKKSDTENNIAPNEENDIKSVEDELDLATMDLSDLLKLLDYINKKIETYEIIDEKDVELSEKILNEIKQRRKY
jgi:hypothetical protein